MPALLTTALVRVALVLAFVALPACSSDDADVPRTEFRANGDHFEIDKGDGKGWRRYFPRGVDLAIAKPGFFPGELSATRADYMRWFDGISAANIDLLRVYTLHYPAFYEALRDYNLAHKDKPLYLLQGIWLDEIEHCDVSEKHPSGVTIHCDYITERTAQLEEETAYVVDAVHGDAAIAERLGKASGIYTADVSPWLMGLLPGHEMDGNAVRDGNLRWAPYTVYNGRYISMTEGSPTEGWVARGLDLVAARTIERWGRSYPVGWSNWPALDPIHHPTEPTTFLQDVVDCDFGKYETKGGFDRGVYVSYHIYPFNPEFIIHDPGYAATVDSKGKINSYLGYLLDLKAHHKNVPVLVSELGIPSSMGVAHVNHNAYDHGGYNEQEQAEILVDQIESCVAANMAGTVVFEWIDEWFKRTWTCTPTMLPAEHGPLWYDVISPEESFGLVSYWPVPGLSRDVDGLEKDWIGASNTFEVASQAATPLAPAADGKDAARTLTGTWLAHDPAFLYLKLALGDGGTNAKAMDGAAALGETVVLVGISTIDGATGDRKLAELPGLQTADDLGFELWLTLDKAAGKHELRVDNLYDPTPRLNGTKKAGGTPQVNDDGLFVLASHIVNNNAQYIAEAKSVIPEKHYYEAGILRYGDATKDTLSHVFAGPDGVVEARLPWHALWITDPAGRNVLYDDEATAGFDAKPTGGVRILVLTAKRGADGKLSVVDALPRAAWHPGTPLQAKELPLFTWPTWTSVSSKERFKPAYTALQKLYGELEAK